MLPKYKESYVSQFTIKKVFEMFAEHQEIDNGMELYGFITQDIGKEIACAQKYGKVAVEGTIDSKYQKIINAKIDIYLKKEGINLKEKLNNSIESREYYKENPIYKKLEKLIEALSDKDDKNRYKKIGDLCGFTISKEKPIDFSYTKQQAADLLSYVEDKTPNLTFRERVAGAAKHAENLEALKKRHTHRPDPKGDKHGFGRF